MRCESSAATIGGIARSFELLGRHAQRLEQFFKLALTPEVLDQPIVPAPVVPIIDPLRKAALEPSRETMNVRYIGLDVDFAIGARLCSHGGSPRMLCTTMLPF